MTDADRRTEGGLILTGGDGGGPGDAGPAEGGGGGDDGNNMPPERRMLEPDILRLVCELKLFTEQVLGGITMLPSMHMETERASAVVQASVNGMRMVTQAGVAPTRPSDKQIAAARAQTVEQATIGSLLRAVATAQSIKELMRIELKRREQP